MNFGLIFIGALVVLWLLIKIAPRLLVRRVAQVVLKQLGKRALAKVPEQIKLSRVSTPQWKDEAAIQQQAAPLVRAGFADLGTYTVDKMPGVLIRMMFQPQTYVAAQITEHPRAGNWIEFATRYNDDGSDFLSTLPDQGIVAPPFVRNVRAAKGTPTDSLYQQHLQTRRSSGIKAVSPSSAIHEFEEGYMRYMIWKNDTGLSAEEVAHRAREWAKAKRAGAGQS